MTKNSITLASLGLLMKNPVDKIINKITNRITNGIINTKAVITSIKNKLLFIKAGISYITSNDSGTTINITTSINEEKTGFDLSFYLLSYSCLHYL